jgi:hypothetical protein
MARSTAHYASGASLLAGIVRWAKATLWMAMGEKIRNRRSNGNIGLNCSSRNPFSDRFPYDYNGTYARNRAGNTRQ